MVPVLVPAKLIGHAVTYNAADPNLIVSDENGTVTSGTRALCYTEISYKYTGTVPTGKKVVWTITGMEVTATEGAAGGSGMIDGQDITIAYSFEDVTSYVVTYDDNDPYLIVSDGNGTIPNGAGVPDGTNIILSYTGDFPEHVSSVKWTITDDNGQTNVWGDSDNPGVFTVDGSDLSISYSWAYDTFDVSFASQDGGTIYQYTDFSWQYASLGYEYLLAALPKNLTKLSDAQYDYTFVGWSVSPNSTVADAPVSGGGIYPITGPGTFYAAFSETLRTYTVTWQDHDGTVLDTETYDYGDTPSFKKTPPTAYQTDTDVYTFSGWGTISSVTGDAVYTAQYSSAPLASQTYTVTFKGAGGKTLDTQQVQHGTDASAPAQTPTMRGSLFYSYKFTSWDKSFDNVTGDLTVTAQFSQQFNWWTVAAMLIMVVLIIFALNMDRYENRRDKKVA